MNLLSETLLIIKEHNKKESEILWVGTRQEFTDWETFKKYADFDYNEGFGAEEINGSLLIVANDWWLERHEYDGSEWWEFKTLPQQPPIKNDDLDLRCRY